MNPLRAFAAILACVLPVVALAQWQWVDKDGRRVFSDKAPPPEIPTKSILRQPGVRGPVVAAPEPAAAAASAAAPVKTAAASAPAISGKDKELEDKKKQAEAAEAEKKKVQEQEVASARAESCQRAQRAKATFDSGVRVSRTNDKGEREVLDDKQRAAETGRLQAVIARDCKVAQ